MTMKEYSKTDRQLHWLSQVIAKVNRAFVPEKKDDSHTNLYFDPLSGRLMGRWIESEKGKFIHTLNLDSLHFEWLDHQFRVHNSRPIWDKTLEQLEDDTADFVAGIGLDRTAISRELHFQIPDYHISLLNASAISEVGLANWKHLRDLANMACQYMLGFLQAKAEIRIWPHHFDTGFYAPLAKNVGIGFGLAMEDAVAGEPYFYMAGYSNGEPIEYGHLPELKQGRWEVSEKWKGALLPVTEIDISIPDVQKNTLSEFILRTALWFLRHL